jgi:hypothetical protein
MLASCEAWGGTLSALRPHHLSITLIARCIAKYRSPDTYPCFGAGVYTVHTHSSLPSALLSSNRTPRCSMMHPASAPRAIPQLKAEPSPASVGFPTQQKISAQAVFGACHPRGLHLHQSGSSSHPKRSRQNPTPTVGEARGNGPSITERTLRRLARSSMADGWNGRYYCKRSWFVQSRADLACEGQCRL